MEEARGRQRALSWLTRLLGRGPPGPVAPLLSSERSSARRFPANVIYEDEEVAAALLCARFLFPSLPFPPSPSPGARRRPEPRTRCAVPGSAAGRVAALLRVGGWRDGGRTGPLWVVALSTAPSLKHRASSVPPPPPAAAARTGLLVLSGSPRFAAPPCRVRACVEEGL